MNTEKAIEALRRIADHESTGKLGWVHWAQMAREALAQLEAERAAPAEPVAWMVEDADGRHFIFRMQKPVVSAGQKLTPLYATPAAPAQDLTDAAIEQLLTSCGGRWEDGSHWVIEDADLHPFVRAAIAAAGHAPQPLTLDAFDEHDLCNSFAGLPVEWFNPGPSFGATKGDSDVVS